MLYIRLFAGRGLTLPQGVSIPPAVQNALQNGGSPRRSTSKRESMQRNTKWWLPYVILEFDRSQMLVEAIDGDLANPVYNYRTPFDVFGQATVIGSVYLRMQQPQDKHQSMSQTDILLARIEFTPQLDGFGHQENWYQSVLGAGAFHLDVQFKPAQKADALSIDSFELLKVIGKGSFGKVMQVRKKDTQRVYALKTIRKANIAARPGEITHILAERIVLSVVNSPFIVPLKFSFQTPDKLYLGMSFVNGGELFHHLQREGRFDENRSRFYAAELLLALEHLHGFDIVYRDLKPENILLDYTGHIALCDFGLCKLNMTDNERTNTFCGTPEYIAPELLESQGYTKTVDWWTLGVLLYEMLTGLPPFYDENVNVMYQRILSDPLNFPPDVAPDARGIMTGLLQRNPAHRLGANGAEDIKRHPFFSKHIDWTRLLQRKIQPPFKPNVESVLDVANFDTEFTNEAPQDSVVEDSALSQTIQDRFEGFTYNPRNDHLSESVQHYGSVMG